MRSKIIGLGLDMLIMHAPILIIAPGLLPVFAFLFVLFLYRVGPGPLISARTCQNFFFKERKGLALAGPLFARVKETAGIVGLDVVPNAREVFISLYKKTLNEIKAVPEDEGYRKAVESFTTNRLRVCEEEEDWEQIEKKLACGQVEELIKEAQDELTLISKMIEWDPWCVPDDYECEVIENDAPVPKHVPLHHPGPLPEELFKTLEAITSAPKKDAAAIKGVTCSHFYILDSVLSRKTITVAFGTSAKAQLLCW